jgi:hypothetical protein
LAVWSPQEVWRIAQKNFMSYLVFLTNSKNPALLHSYYTDLLHFPIRNHTLMFSMRSIHETMMENQKGKSLKNLMLLDLWRRWNGEPQALSRLGTNGSQFSFPCVCDAQFIFSLAKLLGVPRLFVILFVTLAFVLLWPGRKHSLLINLMPRLVGYHFHFGSQNRKKRIRWLLFLGSASSFSVLGLAPSLLYAKALK